MSSLYTRHPSILPGGTLSPVVQRGRLQPPSRPGPAPMSHLPATTSSARARGWGERGEESGRAKSVCDPGPGGGSLGFLVCKTGLVIERT